jgi:peroxiredoxin Q/BCP
MSVEIGHPFPPFTAQTQDEETVNLMEYGKGSTLVVFFYPRANTSGCVKETTEFSTRSEEFTAAGARLVGVSVDAPRWQQKHAITCAVNYPLLADTDKALTTELGILSDMGMSKRTTYVLDCAGVVRKVFPDVKVDGHVDEVLTAVKEIST